MNAAAHDHEDGKANALHVLAMSALLERLNQCRAQCPGIGGDVDAMNVRFLIREKHWNRHTVWQAFNTLTALCIGLGFVCSDILALLIEINHAAALRIAATDVCANWEKGDLAAAVRQLADALEGKEEA